MKATDPPIIVEEHFSTSRQEVWKAITQLSQMKQWFFEQIESFEPEEGFETDFVVEHEGRVFTHQWKIMEVVPGEKIKYNWKYKEYPGDSYLSFVLNKEGESGTKLRVISEVVKDFPDNIPEFRRESCEGGWKYFIQERLKNYLEPQ